MDYSFASGQFPHSGDLRPAERFCGEICVSAWVAAIVLIAWFTGFPNNIPWWLWVVGMAACAPVTAVIGARRDRETTISRELVYFFRPGFALMKIVFWPVTIAFAYFFDSQRRCLIDSLFGDLYNKHGRNGMRRDTAREIAMKRVEKFDRRCDAVESAATCVAEGAKELPAVACRTSVLAATLSGVAGTVVCAAQDQKPAATPTTSILMVRTGQNLQSPHTGTYHLAEFFQVRGKWIYPDVGYVDFATNTYREFFAGGGWTFVDGKKVTLTGEGYFVQDTGPAAHGARYLWVNPILNVRITPKFTWQTSYFPYLPLNRSGTFQQVLERSKLERTLTRSVKVSAGYGMYDKAGSPPQNKPFVGATFSTRAGSLELWAQHVPAGAQVQARYVFAHTSKR